MGRIKPHPSKTASFRLSALARGPDAVALRIQGLSFREIAERLGLNRQTAHDHVTKWMRETTAEARAQSHDLRALEAGRLDALQAAHWPKALGGDVRASMVVLGCMQRRAKLFGLDEPDRLQLGAEGSGAVTAATSEADLLARWIRDYRRRHPGEPVPGLDEGVIETTAMVVPVPEPEPEPEHVVDDSPAARFAAALAGVDD